MNIKIEKIFISINWDNIIVSWFDAIKNKTHKATYTRDKLEEDDETPPSGFRVITTFDSDNANVGIPFDNSDEIEHDFWFKILIF